MTQTPRAPRFIAVASGKGGVGKTWFSITLAHALALQGRRVLLFDGDLGLANVDIQLGLIPVHDLADVLLGAMPIHQAIQHCTPGGFDVLAGRSGSGTLANLPAARLEDALQRLAVLGAGYDHVLLDLGAGVEAAVRRMAAWAERLLVLATDEPTSVTDAYATLKLHAADGAAGTAQLIVNQAQSAASAARTAATIRKACTTFLGHAPDWLGGIRRDMRVPEAIRRQTLLLTRHPTSAAAEDVGRIVAGF